MERSFESSSCQRHIEGFLSACVDAEAKWSREENERKFCLFDVKTEITAEAQKSENIFETFCETWAGPRLSLRIALRMFSNSWRRRRRSPFSRFDFNYGALWASDKNPFSAPSCVCVCEYDCAARNMSCRRTAMCVCFQAVDPRWTAGQKNMLFRLWSSLKVSQNKKKV